VDRLSSDEGLFGIRELDTEVFSLQFSEVALNDRSMELLAHVINTKWRASTLKWPTEHKLLSN
jgi:hypothetical protein